MHSVAEIISFLKSLTGDETIKPDTDIYKELGVYGDDFDEIIEKYAEKFSVNLDGYLWFFHTEEEGQNFGGFFFKPPNSRVERIPVTPNMLKDFANNGKWNITYPNHKIPKKRYDILINRIIAGLILVYIMVWVVKNYLI